MSKIYQRNIVAKIYKLIPITLLFISVLNEVDFNNLGMKYFSFNFAYILIFYYSLKKTEGFSYSLIFIAGLFNDVVVGTPMGISSLIYLLLCGAASYLRNITLRPNLMKDWIFFLITISIVKSISYLVLTFIFGYEVILFDQIINIIFTFIFYLIFIYLFDFIRIYFMGRY